MYRTEDTNVPEKKVVELRSFERLMKRERSDRVLIDKDPDLSKVFEIHFKPGSKNGKNP